MRLAGHQPHYFPRLHLFARFLDSDVFVISDYVQFVKKHAFPTSDGKGKRGKSYQAHAPIKLSSGIFDLGVPIKREGLLPMNKTRIEYGSPWHRKHLKTIEIAYGRARSFLDVYPELNALLTREYENLAQLNIATILWALTRILTGSSVDIATLSPENVNALLMQNHPFRLRRVSLISTTPIAPPGENRDATDWIVETCRTFGADEYQYGGTGAASYMNFDTLRKAGIKTLQQNWVCTPYPQQNQSIGFMPNLSIIDLLANADRELVWQVLTGA
ncbi:MAG: WbqC family protein [Parcubacteria group bacterium]|nr:WbqC family protein [Parcubacteria group bacterium]